jgi:hypothetical protein
MADMLTVNARREPPRSAVVALVPQFRAQAGAPVSRRDTCLVPGAERGQPHGLAVTADGAHLYTTSINGRVVSHFKIAGFTTAGG